MAFVDLFFGWQRRVRRLRRKWDREREKALRKKEPLRGSVLSKLDGVENSLRVLEEQNMSRVARARIAKEIEIDLEEIAELLRLKREEAAEAFAARKQ